MSLISSWLADAIKQISTQLTRSEWDGAPQASLTSQQGSTLSELLRQLQLVVRHLRGKHLPVPLPPTEISLALIQTIVTRCNEAPHPSNVSLVRTMTKAFPQEPLAYLDIFTPRPLAAAQRDAFVGLLAGEHPLCLVSWHTDRSLGGGARYLLRGKLVDASLRGTIDRLFSSSTLL